ncbi:Sugar transporter STL1 [Paramyrothecium foliicola]|nr:Sugar transporter STL1 [Paramyrothecium foliicola]
MFYKISCMGLSGKSLRNAQIAFVVAPGFTLFGYNQAGLGPLATLQSWVHQYHSLDTVNTAGQLKSSNSTHSGAVIASFQIGALIGALSCIFLGDALGRRKTIFLAALLTLVGQVLQVASSNLIQFVVGRIVLGMGVGEISVMIPVWLAECSPASHRGRDVVTAGIFMCLGYAVCNWVDFAFYHLPASNLQWRLPLAVISLPLSLAIMCVIFFLPESPRWLVRVGKTTEATRNLAALKGLTSDDERIRLEIAQIESSLEFAADKSASLMQLFSKDDKERLLYRFFLCIFLQFVQQMCGGNLISVYASTIFQQNLDLGTSLSKILAACALSWKFLCCFISFFAIDRLGRRAVFIISGAGMSMCMLALAVSTSFPSSNQSASIASAFFIFMFNFFYPIGFLGANFLYCSEIAPVRLRVAMNSVSTANHWLWNFVVVMVTPVAISTIGYRYYIMYTIISALIPIAVYFFYPETMNRNLESLNNLFRDASSPRQVVSLSRNMSSGDESLESTGGKTNQGEVEQAERV